MGIKPRRIRIVKGTSFRRNGAIHTQIIGPAGMENERQKLKEMLDRNLEGLAPTTVQALADITSSQADPPQNSEYDNDVIMAMGGEDGESWVDIPLMDQPESEVFMYAVREMLLNRSVHQRRQDDTRTQRQRLQSLDENWTSVLPQLVTAYLQWKSYSSATHDSQEVGESPYTFSIDVLDIYTLEKTARIVPAEDETSIAVALVSNGFLGTTPIRPSRAISLRTLELLRRLRRRQPSFSCEAFSRILCDYYEIPYRRTYRTTISNAFDIYLTILRHVDQMVQKALNQDTPDWRAKHACPPCGYVLKDEPPLRFSRMYCIDGNDSLKRMASTGTRDLADRRVFQDSDYFLPRAYVDKYAHEVKARRLSPEDVATKVTHDDPSSADGPATTNQTSNDDEDCEGLEEGDPTDGKSGDPALSGCVKNWKAAASDSKKRMWGVFEETGLFASMCRHGMFLWVADMVRSGEQAKYPLAIVAKVLETLESRSCCAYDIGCSFESTLLSSSLGPEFQRQKAKCIVNAFHGYSHGYSCQTRYHPNNTEGMGLSDLEDLERAFSSSNRLAPVIRHATPYRRHVAIECHLQQHDEDKYANLATLIYDNYVQALCLIADEGAALREAMEAFKLSEDDLRRFIEEEYTYVGNLGQEDPYDVHAVAYVEMLQEYQTLQSHFVDAHTHFLMSIPEDYAPQSSGKKSRVTRDISETQRREADRRFKAARLAELELQLAEMEVHMQITARWEPVNPAYIEAMKYSTDRAYHRALDHLQKLVVQRLFELQKLNLAGTGYRMRTHIAKSLQTRCKAIQNAVKKYNDAAAALNPPRPSLDWSAVSQYSFLDHFTLLRGSPDDINTPQWAQPVVREMLRQYRRLKRAEEEIVRCNVEVRRLHTWVLAENRHMESVLTQLRMTSEPICVAVEERCRRRRSFNDVLMWRIHQIHALPGYTGETTPGVSAVNVWGVEEQPAIQEYASLNEGLDELGEDLVDSEDLAEAEISNLVDYIGQLTVVA